MAATRGPRPPEAVRFSLPPLDDATLQDLRSSRHHDQRRVADLDLTDLELRQTTFAECALERLVLHGADLRGMHLVECRLAALDAASCALPHSSWRDVVLDGSRLGALECYESTWRSLLVTDSKFGYLNARGSSWTDVTFRNCVVDELDLSNARLTRVRFEGCRVRSLRVADATLADVDLRGVRLEEIEGLAGLAGAWFSESQLTELAPLLADHLGIRVI
jgi:uncharacterized protein YjbI with pentapeptide repeats